MEAVLKWSVVVLIAAVSLVLLSGKIPVQNVEARPEVIPAAQQGILNQIYNQVSRGISSGTGSGFVIDTQGHIITGKCAQSPLI